jgi:hypothetical protein
VIPRNISVENKPPADDIPPTNCCCGINLFATPVVTPVTVPVSPLKLMT